MSPPAESVADVSVAALDLLLEKNDLEAVRALKTDYDDAQKVLLYLRELVSMSTDEKVRSAYLQVCCDISVSHGLLSGALDYALMLPTREAFPRVRELFAYCTDLAVQPKTVCVTAAPQKEGARGWRPVASVDWQFADAEKERSFRALVRKQLAYQLAEHRFVPDYLTLKFGPGYDPNDPAVEAAVAQDDAAEIDTILRRDYVAPLFDALATELDVVAPKKVEDILKSDDVNTRSHAGSLEASRNAMACSYASGFVHAGYGVDCADEDNIQKTRSHGVTAAIGVVGLLNLWRVEEGLSELDKYQYSQDNFTRAGALIGFGCCNSGTYNDCDPVLSLVSYSFESDDVNERMGAYISLGYSYCGTQRDDLFQLLLPAILMTDANATLEASSYASLALGLIFTGSCNKNLVEILLQVLNDHKIDTLHVYNYGIAIGLIYLMSGAQCEAPPADSDQVGDSVDELLSSLDHPMKKFIRLMILSCSYACTGDILKCQKCLEQCVNQEPAAKPTSPPTADVSAAVVATAGENGELPPLQKGAPAMTAEQTVAALQKLAESEPQPAPAPETEQDMQEESIDEVAGGATTEPRDDAATDNAQPGTAAVPPTETTERPAAAETADGKQTSQPLTNLVRDEIQKVNAGLALIAYTLIVLGEGIGEEMLLRLLNHMLQYDNVTVRRAVPLSLALLSPSAPKRVVVDVLSKLTHDSDADTALHAIIALGVVSAGTNNARVAQLLRSLASFYSVDAEGLFLVKVAQGLLYAGKGLHTFSPLHKDKKLVNRHSLAGLIAFVVQCLFTKETLCQGRYHLNLLHLCLSIRPRWLITVDEEGNSVGVPVRVGQYVDVAGIAGQPRQIAGFRNHSTPILLNDGEKAEIGCPEWQPLASCLEGVVVVRKTDPSELKDASKSLE